MTQNIYMKFSGFLAVGFATKILGVIIKGLVLTKLWEWFVVPTFELPKISIPIAIGFAMIVHFLTWHADTSSVEEEKERDWGAALIHVAGDTMLPSAFFFVFGWVVKFFV